MAILLFIVILLVLVLIHEFGHFIVAKLFRIRVDEFAFGFPPRIFGKKIGETMYALNLLPLGGYVKIFGENPADVPLEAPNSERSFVAKPRFVQAAVVLAGVVGNWFLAWGILWVVLILGVSASAYDLPEGEFLENPRLLVTEVLLDSPAEKAGLRSGDEILRVEGLAGAIEREEITTLGGFSEFVSTHPEDVLTLDILRAGEELSLSATPVTGINPKSPSTPAIGVLLDIEGKLRYTPFSAISKSFMRTWEYTLLTGEGLWGFLEGALSGSADLTQVTGPVGIVKVVGEASAVGVVPLLFLTALISINLSIINLLPFPALDGGRLVFIILEGILRRPISPKFQNVVNTVGFATLLLLMFFITYHDIVKL